MWIEKTRDQSASKFRDQEGEAESAKVTEIKQLGESRMMSQKPSKKSISRRWSDQRWQMQLLGKIQ